MKAKTYQVMRRLSHIIHSGINIFVFSFDTYPFCRLHLHLFPLSLCCGCHPPCTGRLWPGTSTQSLWSQRTAQGTLPHRVSSLGCYVEHLWPNTPLQATTWRIRSSFSYANPAEVGCGVLEPDLKRPHLTHRMSLNRGLFPALQSLQNQLPCGISMFKHSRWNAAGQDSQHRRLPPAS